VEHQNLGRVMETQGALPPSQWHRLPGVAQKHFLPLVVVGGRGTQVQALVVVAVGSLGLVEMQPPVQRGSVAPQAVLVMAVERVMVVGMEAVLPALSNPVMMLFLAVVVAVAGAAPTSEQWVVILCMVVVAVEAGKIRVPVELGAPQF
jgi:hypothetical protein